MLKVVERIVAPIDVPVTADLEAGYGDPPRTAAAGSRSARPGSTSRTRTARPRRCRSTSRSRVDSRHARGWPTLVLNARVDVFITRDGRDRGGGRARQRLPGRRRRLHLSDPRAVRDARPAAEGITGPVNVLALPENPRLQELEELGVARVTFGPALASAALAEASRLAAAALLAARS